MAKNTMGKTVSRSDAYQVWQTPDGSWTWYVRKAYQGDEAKPYARWLCDVVTPMVPNGETGDVYVSEVKANARRIDAGATAAEAKPPCHHGIINITGYTEGGDIIGRCFFCEEEVAS